MGVYQAKENKLSQYQDLALSLLDQFSFTIDSVPRRENWHTDVMVSVASLISLDEGIKEYHFVVYILLFLAISNQPEFNALVCVHHELGGMVFSYLQLSED